MCKSGIGMPDTLKLEAFAALVRDAFAGEDGHVGVYQVGSSLATTVWRDVDVRVMLDDDVYRARFGDPAHPHEDPRWVATVLAFSALGREMTGLPIDFQVQDTTTTNEKDAGPRSAIGIRRQVGESRRRQAAARTPTTTEENR